MVRRLHYAWVISICAMLTMFCTVGLGSSSFVVFQPYLIRVAGLTNSQASATIMVRSIFSLAAMGVVSLYSRKLGVRWAIGLSVCGTASAFFLYASAGNSFLLYCAASALVGTFYTLGGIVPASLLVERWFESHRGIAFGICSIGTSIASILMPPLLTLLIDRYSLRTAFLFEAGLLLATALVIALLVRESPESMGITPLGHGSLEVAAQMGHGRSLSRAQMLAMCFAMLLLGTIGNTGYSHLGVLFAGEGFDGTTISLLLSLAGLILTVSKCVYGQAVDHIGAYRTGFFFFAATAFGVFLCTLPGLGGIAGGIAAVVLQGIGLALCSVGISVFAGELAPREKYGVTIRSFQTSYTCGAILFGSCPGLIADLTGSYRPAFMLLTVFSLVAGATAQGVYHRVLKRERIA